MNVRLFEIFTSVEGEGIFYGTKTLFIRLAGCPFSCFYCDTKDAIPINSGKLYSVSEVCRLIDKNLQKNTYKVNFTGGDPLLQHEAVAELAKYVKSRQIPTYLESSCFDSKRFQFVLPHIDYLKIEFKTEDSELVEATAYPRIIQNALTCLKSAINSHKRTYIKIVVSSKTNKTKFSNLIKTIFTTIKKDDIEGFILQPTYGISEPTLDDLMKLYDTVFPLYKEVRIIPQLHKFINAP